MAGEKILVVEDEEDIRKLIAFNLKGAGYSVLEASTGEMALDQASSHNPDLILLDLMLPTIDGLEVCKRLKANDATRDVPIIIVSAKGEEADVVTGLELGADDYVPKPFRPRELIARAKAALRRNSKPASDATQPLSLLDLEIDPGRREVRVAGLPVVLTFTEFEVLHFLAQRPGWVFTRYQIVDAVRGEDYAVTDRSVDVQITGLRKKLGAAGSYVETVRNVGYRFKDPYS